jgi:hypothetical protein
MLNLRFQLLHAFPCGGLTGGVFPVPPGLGGLPLPPAPPPPEPPDDPFSTVGPPHPPPPPPPPPAEVIDENIDGFPDTPKALGTDGDVVPPAPPPPTVIGYGVAPQTERHPVLKPPAPPPPAC